LPGASMTVDSIFLSDRDYGSLKRRKMTAWPGLSPCPSAPALFVLRCNRSIARRPPLAGRSLALKSHNGNLHFLITLIG
jgi:hypothetical protein